MLAPKNMLEHLQSLRQVQERSDGRRKSQLRNKMADIIQNRILQNLCLHPYNTAYHMYKNQELALLIDYKTIRKHFTELCQRGFIERFEKEDSEHSKKPGRLTSAGIYHLILKMRIMPGNIIKAILRNYGNHALFQPLLYPYINLDTLLKITDIRLVSRISLFLYECCREIEDFGITKGGNITEQVFFWQRVPDNKNETSGLCHFLKQELNINWADHGKIEKRDDDNSLSISNNNNTISIKLDNTKTKATLKVNGHKRYEFKVETGPKGLLSIGAPTKAVQEFVASSLFVGITQRVPALVFNLISDLERDSSNFHILSEDRRFMRTLKKTKTKFDKQCKMLGTT
jgi:hypothetical protein